MSLSSIKIKQYKAFIIFTSIFLFATNSFAYLIDVEQTANTALDSIDFYVKKINTTKSDDALKQYQVLVDYIKYLEKSGQWQKAEIECEKAVVLTKKNNLSIEYANILMKLGSFQSRMSKFDLAIKSFDKALPILEKNNDAKQLVKAYYFYGALYDAKANYPKAAKLYFKALKLANQLHNDTMVGILQKNLGTVLHLQSKDTQAIDYLQKARSIFIKLNDNNHIANCENDIANIYADLKQYQIAFETYNSALRMFKSTNDLAGITLISSNLAELYLDIKDFDKAESYALTSKFYAQKLGEIENLISCYSILGRSNFQKKMYAKSFAYLDTAENIAVKNESVFCLPEIYEHKSLLFENQKNFKMALKYHKLFKALNDTVFNTNSTSELATMKENFLQEQLEKDRELKLKENQIAAQKQQWVLYFLVAGLISLLIIAFILMRLNRTKRNANVVLIQKNNTVEEQKKIIEHKNKEITDSIVYAQTIQKAILPNEIDFAKCFSKSFVFYKPKDIVSGDFYWVHSNDKFAIYATADCTGHGVPGGFMSMLSASLLNEIIVDNENFEPATILNLMREKIIYSLKQNNFDSQNKDGLDMVICVIHKHTLQLCYAGANNGLYIFDNQKTMHELKPDKQPIGVSGTHLKPFTQHTIQLQKGNRVYTYTDGYTDQFGGEKGKKLKYKNFENLLADIQSISMKNQGVEIENYFTNWMGSLEQVDDVTVIGIEV